MTDKKEITLSIMPTYKCEMDCDYCYLQKDKKRYSEKLFVNKLYKRLKALSAKYTITTVEVYGGNIKELFTDELMPLIEAYRCYCKNDRIMCNDVPWAMAHGFKERNINISLNPERRDFLYTLHDAKVHSSVGIITVATHKLLLQPLDTIFDWYKNFRGNVTIMPYSNCSPNYPVPYVSNAKYCSFMMEFIDYYLNNIDKYKFKLTNILMLQDCINGLYSPAMRNNIFITPEGKFACVDFDVNGNEYFHTFSSLDKWESRCAVEDIDRIKYCGTCENFNCCMAEHHKNPEQKPWFEKKYGDCCNGYKPLVEWAKERLRGFSY